MIPNVPLPDNSRPIRALLDALDRIPPSRFGRGNTKAKILRKFVLVSIAASADPDGTNAYPGEALIAARCACTERAVRKAIAWLIKHRLLSMKYKGSKWGTNKYTVRFPKQKGTRNPRSGSPGTVRQQTRNYEHGTRNCEQRTRNPRSANRPLPPIPPTKKPPERETENGGSRASASVTDKAVELYALPAVLAVDSRLTAIPRLKKALAEAIDEGYVLSAIVSACREIKIPDSDKIPSLTLAHTLLPKLRLLESAAERVERFARLEERAEEEAEERLASEHESPVSGIRTDEEAA